MKQILENMQNFNIFKKNLPTSVLYSDVCTTGFQ